MATVTRTTVRNPAHNEFAIQLSDDYEGKLPQGVKGETHPRFMELLAITNGTRPEVTLGQVWSYFFVNEDGSLNEGHVIVLNIVGDGTVTLGTIYLGLGSPQVAGQQWVIPVCDMHLTGDGQGYRLQGTYLPSDVTGEIQRGYSAPSARKGLRGLLQADPVPTYTSTAKSKFADNGIKSGSVTSNTAPSTKGGVVANITDHVTKVTDVPAKSKPETPKSDSPVSTTALSTGTEKSYGAYAETQEALVKKLLEGLDSKDESFASASASAGTVASIVLAVVKEDKQINVINSYRAAYAGSDGWLNSKVDAQKNLLTMIKNDFPGDCKISIKI